MRHLTLALVVLANIACSTGSSVVGGPTDSAVSDIAELDRATIDVPALDIALDVPADAPFRCTTNAACAGNTGGSVCDVTTGACVQCVPSADTCPTGQYCVTGSNTCAAGCRDDAACATAPTDGGTSSATPRCNVTTRACVACVTDDHCPAGNLCVGNLCVVGCNAARTCPTGQTCCSGGCVDTQSNTAACGACDARCMAPNSVPACLNGMCAVGTCTAPFADCNGSVTDGCETNTQSDVDHCGSCPARCAARPNTTARCAAAACAYECVTGFADCDSDPSNGCEVDTRTDAAHCGRCGGACSLANATAACVAGACTVAMCATGFGDCDGNAPNGCETDTRTSVSHCGVCANACPGAPNAVPACATSTCALTCTAGFAECDGSAANGCEVDTRTSATHCGGCGRTCMLANATASCAGSLCAVASCATGFGDCDGTANNGCEVDTRSTVNHCGTCNNPCSFPNAAATCASGACALGACNAGFSNCDSNAANGCEVDTRTDATHCGSCSRACAVANGTPGCAASDCTVAACNTGYANCDGMVATGCEVDTRSDPAHCGGCGAACAAGNNCEASACVPMVGCAAIHARFPSLASGVYSLDPDGAGGAAAFDAYCDMTTDGGGWTLLATVYNTPTTDVRRWNTDAVFSNASTFGTLAGRASDDFKSPAYTTVRANDLLVFTDEYHFGFRTLLGATAFGPYVASQVTSNCAQSWIRSGVDFASSNLDASQQRGLGFVVRGLDFNGGGPSNGCATTGTNENNFLSFASGPSWWLFGAGNCASCADDWTTYDNGMLNRATLTFVACTASTWPCNANGLYWTNAAYPTSAATKTRYVQLLVR